MQRQITNFWLSCSILLALNSTAQRAFSPEMLSNPTAHSAAFERLMPVTEMPVYPRSEAAKNKVLLENGYAQYRFKNPHEWPLQGKAVVPVGVNVIFTKYPKDKAFWLTDYHWLLAKRLTELFKLDSNLNSNNVKFSMTLQTDCDNEFETIQLFHGIEITYEPTANGKAEIVEELEAETPTATVPAAGPQKSEIRKIRQLMNQERYFMDSTVFKALDRNQQWKDALVVVDWTGSMRGYGAEALLWQAMHPSASTIKHYAFFNDGDRTPNNRKVIGYTGGIYTSEAQPLSNILKLLKKLQKKGEGGDSPENDMEALLSSVYQVRPTGDLILIADNASCIRDYVLISQLNRPVHVILCNTGKGINHQYINLAYRTGGSLHTVDTDIQHIDQLLLHNALEIGGIKYTLTSNRVIMPVDRHENYFSTCDRYYNPPRRKTKKVRHKEPECYFTE